MHSFLTSRLLRSTIVAVAACGGWSGAGVCPVVRAERPLSNAERIIAGLEATSASDARMVGSFLMISMASSTEGIGSVGLGSGPYLQERARSSASSVV